MWLVALARAPGALYDRKQRAVWIALVAIATAITLFRPDVSRLLVNLTGHPHAVDLCTYIFSAADAAAQFYFIVSFMHSHRRRTLALYGLPVVIVVTLIWLDTIAPPHTHIAVTDRMFSISFWLIFLGFHCGVEGGCAIACWRYARQADERIVSAGLFMFGFGQTLACLLWLLYLAYIITRTPLLQPLIGSGGSPIIGVEALLLAAGAAAPLVGHTHQFARDVKKFWRLQPLWRKLVVAVPEVTPSPARPRIRDLLSREYPLKLLVHQRAFEVRDAILILRDYVSAATLDRAQAHVQACIVGPVPAELLVTACWIQVACQAKQTGQPPQRCCRELSRIGGDSLEDELRLLGDLAHLWDLPIVAEFLARLDCGGHGEPETTAARANPPARNLWSILRW